MTNRIISLNARMMTEAESFDGVEVLLIEITHPDLEKPVRLSTDNTEMLSSDPIVFGTRSTWRGANPATEPWFWIIADIVPPSDQENEPANASLVILNADTALADQLQGLTGPADAAIALVFADSPNDPEQEWLKLKLTTAEGDVGRVSMTFSREEVEMEMLPAGRMTRQYFPGLHS